MTDWRLPSNRYEALMKGWSAETRAGTLEECFIHLPAFAEALDAGPAQRAWIAWLNSHCHVPATVWLILQVAPHPKDWRKAIDFWLLNYPDLQWSTDRRWTKRTFGADTMRWGKVNADDPITPWFDAGTSGWTATWEYARSQPSMGRMSAWSFIEQTRLMLGDVIPDAPDLMLLAPGSYSHRNGAAIAAGFDAAYWPKAPIDPEVGEYIVDFAEHAFQSSTEWGLSASDPNVSRLSFESMLCAYKSFHKPNRRYPGVYPDRDYTWIKRAERAFPGRFELMWANRQRNVPRWNRLEDNPTDPGIVSVKQNWYMETGEFPNFSHAYPGESDVFRERVESGYWGERSY